jgi:arginine decarboxylase
MSNVSFSPVPPDALHDSKRPPPNGGDQNGTTEWTAERGAARYQIHGWGAPYFHVNARGHVEVRPNPDRPERVINLFELAQELKARGLDLPLLIRFSDIVADRIKRINEAFLKAIAEYEYQGIYRGVYPVKVNQQRHLVEEIVEAGRPYSFGLEAGSKPELLIALAAMQDVGGLIICNGYKDSKYIETALVAQKFDKTVIIVLERLEEIDLVFKASEKLGIRPLLGVRAKLTTKGVGRWKDSAGERAKFGLTTSEMIEVVDRLTARNMLDTLQLLHFHIGSQISSIIPIKNAMQEASNIYVELAKMGCKMGYLDVGGGLAVDYDGSKTDFHASKNYQLEEYAADVVSHIQADVGERKRSRGGRAPLGVGIRGRGREPGALPATSRAQSRRQPPAARAVRHVLRHSAQKRAGKLPRRQPSQRRGAEPVQVRLPLAARALASREDVLELLREDPPHAQAPEVRARGAHASRS